MRDLGVLCGALCGAWVVAGIEYGIGLQNHCICMVLKGFCWEQGTRIIAKSMHLYGLGKWIGGRGTRNHCQIYTFVLFWKLVGGRGARIISKAMHLYGFGRLVGRAIRIIAKSMHVYGFGMLVGGAAHQTHCKIYAFAKFWKVD